MQNKDDFPLFTSALFGKDGNARTLANISSYDNLVLDFDNENGITDSDDILRELQDYTFIYYTTFSSTEEKKKFRIILPFSKSLDQNSFRSLKNKINYILKDFLDGLDGSCYNDARPFYIPALNCESLFNKGIHFNECKLYLDVDLKEATKIINYQLKKPNGRNDVLKAQAFAAFHQGKTIYEVTQELLTYDKANHNPPFFEDPSENHYIKDDPETTAYGFVVSNKKTFRNQGHKVEQTLIINLEEEKKEVKEKKKSFFELEKNLCVPHGFVGEIADWISTNSLKSIPSISLAAALVGMGVVKAHRVRSETNLRTNLYAVGLAPSGAGKEMPMKLIKKLLIESGHEQHIIGEPASGGGLLNSLDKAKGQAFLGWTEVGLGLQAYTAKMAGSHQAQVLKHMLQIFSEADTKFIGGEYANSDGKRSRKDIDQPCLGILGTSVPEEFFNALGESHGSNGFLARWLIFGTNDLGHFKDSFLNDSCPKEFISKLKDLRLLSTNVNATDDLAKSISICPKTVPFDPKAKKRILEIQDYYHKKIEKYIECGNSLESIWQRAQEHIIKISLIISDNIFITCKDVDYSFDLIESILSKSERIYLEKCNQGEFGKLIQIALKKIKAHGKAGMTKSSFLRQFKFDPTVRDRVLRHLQESDQIIIKSVNGKSKPITYLIYQEMGEIMVDN